MLGGVTGHVLRQGLKQIATSQNLQWNLPHQCEEKPHRLEIFLLLSLYLEGLFTHPSIHLTNHICTYLAVFINFQHMLGFIYTGILHVAFRESDIFTDASVLICLK